MTQATAKSPSERRMGGLYGMFRCGTNPRPTVVKSVGFPVRWMYGDRIDAPNADARFNTFAEAIAYADRVARE